MERIVFSCLPLKRDLLCREKFSKANVIELEKDRICGIPIRNHTAFPTRRSSDIAAMSNERGRDDCLLLFHSFHRREKDDRFCSL